MDVLGNALTLYDLGLRVAAFINDLRHAQDDFLGLRAEANCLQVCLNSLCSESCQDTIYLYISKRQREDLELILENTLLNMEDLNRFLGGCKYLVANEAKKMAQERGVREKWKAFWKKAWASYKFAMTDPQPFRDKLALPTQSINIFLTSLTHTGLANMGNLLALTGHLPDAKGIATPLAGPVGTWETIGTRIAFKKSRSVGDVILTADLEDEIIRYALYLVKGGQPFNAKDKEKDDSKLKRTGSKSRNVSGYAKEKGGDTFIMRRKTAYVTTPSKRNEPNEDASWSATDRMPLRLNIPSPSPASRGPASPTSPFIVDAKPHFDVSEDEQLPPTPRRTSQSEVFKARRESAPSAEAQPKQATSGWTRPSRYATSASADVKSSRVDCRKHVEEEIKREQEEAARELRDSSVRVRSERRSRMSHKYSYDEPKQEEIHVSDSEEIINLLEEQYGLQVERLVVDRPTIDNGTVVPVMPASLVEPDEVEEATPTQSILPKRGARLTSETSFYDRSYRNKRSRFNRMSESPTVPRREAFISRYHTYPQESRSTSPSVSDRSDQRYREERLTPNQPPSRPRSSAPNVIVYDHDNKTTRDELKPRARPSRGTKRRSASYSGPEPASRERSHERRSVVVQKRGEERRIEDAYRQVARSERGSISGTYKSGSDSDG